MGTIILIIAFVVEASFATYCILTKSRQPEVRSLLRIGALAAFGLLMLVSIIQWSTSWCALAVLLLTWAALGARTLTSKKAEKKEFKPWPSVFRAIGTLLLVFIAVIPALILPQYTLPKPTGKHAVATVNFTYTDAGRTETFSKTGGSRKVNVEFWYPKDSGDKYPLVVFSHGSFGTKASNTSTFLDLASNGYVVCSIDHPYHSLLTIDSDGHLIPFDQSYYQEVIDANAGKYDEATLFRLEQKWIKLRTDDINFVLDTVLLQAKGTGSATVYQLIDPSKIGLMGHSLGGESSAQVARERNDIDAVINLDADLSGEYLDFKDGKTVLNDRTYPVPILTIFTDTLVRMMDAAQDPNEVIAVKHVIATAPQAYAIHFAGTDHMSLTDVPLVMPLMVDIINISVPKAGGVEVDPYATIEKMNHTVLEFFNDFLKGEGSFTVAGLE